jgi:hypothetical protein
MDKDLFDTWAENAHVVTFNEHRPSEMNRYDFALIAVKDGKLIAYGLCREFDSESLYLGFGGCFPEHQKSRSAVEWYEKGVEWSLQRYKRVTTLIENENVPMLRVAFHCGLRVIGVKIFKQQIFCELMREV